MKEDLSKRLADLPPELLSRLVGQLKKRGVNAPDRRIPRRGHSGTAPLSYAQQRLWFLDQFRPDDPFYNLPSAYMLNGALNLEALQQSFFEIVDRHEALRTTFSSSDGQPIQVISSTVNFQLPLIDLSHLDES